MTVFRCILPLCALCLLISVAHGQAPSSATATINWNKAADSAAATLDRDFYDPNTHYYHNSNRGDTTFHYWPQAHALDVLTDAYLRTRSPRYLTRMNEWMDGVRRKNGNTFLNEYYDDMLWNALAMLRVYEATHDKKWLTATLTLWEDIKTGWNETMGGGIAWRKGQRYYKNTPANGPAIILAARLHRLLRRPADLAWAKRIYNWEKKTLVDAASGLVYDGINQDNDGKLNTRWKFTYCQGVWIGGAHELYKITKDRAYLTDAVKTADLSLTDPTLTTNGLMRDEGKGDGGLFKGVLVRYLTQLVLEPGLDKPRRNRYAAFLRTNAQTLWQQGTARPALAFGTFWQRPPAGGHTDLPTQLSGIMLLEATSLLERSRIF
ncbi:putative alpha-1,6-mannanase (GH76 family) [Spirosoma oryzae]|uniref:Putative alpha-1,6-mannanase (GH76 family) n=1 Tax=Spirosoma oryzae TaxID=1469603 RepID=A0A2T0SRA8_9BACT|nr:glycoside hydrolase family 76 protein [Spirosoma oryzae]PRY35940.1 putative alpha-1,6-mannanase (GH76 family) [Spirosoma oryzae]